MGVINLLERCRKRGIKKFLQASSSSVYGPLEEVCDENARGSICRCRRTRPRRARMS